LNNILFFLAERQVENFELERGVEGICWSVKKLVEFCKRLFVQQDLARELIVFYLNLG